MQTVDYAVIGAGMIGYTAAFQLHRTHPQAQIAVVDPAPASLATFAAAGMLAPIAEVQYQQQQLYPLMVAAGQYWPELINQLAAATGATPEQLGYRSTETFVVGVDAADRQYLLDLAQVQQAHQMQAKPVPVSQVRRAEPALAPRLAAAISIPTDHQIDPRRCTQAIAEYFAQTTTVQHIAARVDSLTLHDDAVVLKTSDGQQLRAGHTVIANALGATELLAHSSGQTTEGIALSQLQLGLRPVHGDILRVRVPQRLQPLVNNTVRAVVRGLPVYLVPREDGTLVLGATSREDDLSGPQLGGVYELLRDAQTVCPGVRETEILEVIARARPGTADDMPLFGLLHPRLLLATGFHRHGILLSALAAALTPTLLTAEADSLGREQFDAVQQQQLATMNPYRFHHSNPGQLAGHLSQ